MGQVLAVGADEEIEESHKGRSCSMRCITFKGYF